MATCAAHPDVALALVCSRCGDFTCPECARDFPVDKAVCNACLDRADGGQRLRLAEVPVAFPSACPTCRAPATIGIPMIARGERDVRFSWPHCAACAADEASLSSRFFQVIVGVLSLMVYGARVTGSPRLQGIAVVVALLGGVVAWIVHRARTVRPSARPGAVAFGAGVRLLRVEYALPLLRKSYVVEIVDPRYARVFAAMNESIIRP